MDLTVTLLEKTGLKQEGDLSARFQLVSCDIIPPTIVVEPYFKVQGLKPDG